MGHATASKIHPHLEKCEPQSQHGSGGGSDFISRAAKCGHARKGDCTVEESYQLNNNSVGQKLQCTYKRDLEGASVKSPEYKNAPARNNSQR